MNVWDSDAEVTVKAGLYTQDINNAKSSVVIWATNLKDVSHSDWMWENRR